MALNLQSGVVDLHQRGKLTAQLLADEMSSVDDHHIVPRAPPVNREAPAA